jgi:hypothetical protein
MSKSRSEQKYESLKAHYKAEAAIKEKELHMDLLAVRHEYVPHHLKRKFLTGLGVFGGVYLLEKIIFGKRIPRIIRFTTALSSTVFAPKVYRILSDKLLSVGELDPIEMEMLEDQRLVAETEAAYPEQAPEESHFNTETEGEVADGIAPPLPPVGPPSGTETDDQENKPGMSST